MNLHDLAAEFPRGQVSWRAQTLTQDGSKALALAYIDARDVMDRLDEVCGPHGWQSEFSETPKGRIICRLGILVGDAWVWKSDGAGETDVEGDKGAISDALKRAAVSWGIGRYLYNVGSPWVPCETYEKGGKKHWSSWKDDPWKFVRNMPKPAAPPPAPGRITAALDAIQRETTLEGLRLYWAELYKAERHIADNPTVITAKDRRKAAIEASAQGEAA